MAAKNDSAGLGRASSKEQNNHKGGRSGSETCQLPGPVRSVKNNGTSGGGINRPTRGTGAGKKEY